MLIFIGIGIIIALWVAYEKNKSNKISEKSSKKFWDKETEADLVRRKDITNLPYISIPYDKLPFSDSNDSEIKEVQDNLYQLKEKKIINLTGYSNTDLKLEYGAPNLHLLSEYDHNFTLLTRYLYKWGQLLVKKNQIDDAKTVLTFGIECGTDTSGNYTLLATIYSKENDYPAIEALIQNAQNIKTLMKDATINELRNILNSQTD